jgi:hypothetical protein
MAELSRYARSEAAQAVPTSKAAADYGFSLAERLRSFANTQHNRLDQQAELEGKQAGLTAASGKTGGIDLSDNSTIRSRAFNQGAQLSHAAAIKIDINENIERLKLENEYDLEAFQTKAAGYKKGLLAEVDPVMWAMAEADVDASISGGTISIGKEIHKRDKEEHLGTITKGMGLLLQNIENFSRDGQLEEAQSNIEQLELLLNEGVEAGIITSSFKETELLKAYELSDAQILFGGLKRILEEEGLEAAEKAVEEFAKAELDEEDISATSRDGIVTKMETLLSRERSDISRENAIANAQSAAETKVIKELAKDATYALQHNQIPDDVEELIQRATDNGDTIVAKDLAEELAITKAIINRKVTVGDSERDVSFIHQTTSTMEAIIGNMEKKENLSGFNAKLLERYRTVLADTKTGIQKDILSLAVRQGRITELDGIDYTDPETIAKRMEQLSLVQALYGTTDGSPLTDVESNNLIKTLNDEETTVMQKAQLLQTLVDGFGDDAQGIMKQMFDKDAPEYILVGELLIEGHIGLPADILEGMDLIEKGLVNVPAGLDKEIRIGLGDAAQENPPYAQMVIEAARALYVRKKKGLSESTVDSVDPDQIESILNQITGGVLEINGVKIIAPKRGINEDAFEDRLKDLQPNDLNAMGGVWGEDAQNAVEYVQKATFISIGKGIYHVVLSEPGDPVELLKNKHGDIFVFKYDAKEGLPSTWAEGVTDKDIIPYAKLDREAEAKQEAEKQKKEEGKQQKREEEAEAQIKASEEAFEEGDLGNEYVDELIETITLNEKNTYLSTMERK